MERTFETVLVEQCAPTLAGAKPGNLFRCGGRDPEQVLKKVDEWDRRFRPLGLRAVVLRVCSRTGDCLVYVYRSGWVGKLLAEKEHWAFLKARGYERTDDVEGMLAQLSRRLCLEAEYPHEIGIFLGYPLQDVVGFIENRGRNCTYCGYWKCYGDPADARRRFARYRACTDAYKRLFEKGTPLIRLVVAAA